MNKEQEELWNESMFQNLAEASVKYEDESPINDLEYKFRLTTPDNKTISIGISRDMMLANLSDEELKVIRIKSALIKDLENIKEKFNLGDDTLINLFKHDREVILVSSLSKDGFLRDNLISQIKNFKMNRDKKGPGKKFKFRWDTEEAK